MLIAALLLLCLATPPSPAAAQQPVAGIVNGDTISLADFARDVGRRRELYSMVGQVGEADQADIVEAAWKDAVRNVLYRQEARRRGIAFSDAEIDKRLLASPPDYIRRGVVDANGRFDPALLRAMVTNPDSLANSKPGRTPQQRTADATRLRTVVADLRDRLRLEYLREAVRSSVLSAFVVDSASLRREYERATTHATIDFVRLPCAPVADPPTAEELQDWYALHPQRYTFAEPSRRLAILSWPVIPSRGDTARTITGMRAFARELKAAQARSRDSLLLAVTSQARVSTLILHRDSAATRPLFDACKGQRRNDVVGPVMHDGNAVVLVIDSTSTSRIRTTAVRLPIEAGPNVVDSVLAIASAAQEAYDNGEEFGVIAHRYGKTMNLTPWFTRSAKLHGSYRLAQMAFATPLGVACDVVDVPDLGIVLAVVADSADAGPMSMNAAAEQLRAEVLRDKACLARTRLARAQHGLVTLTPEQEMFVSERLPGSIVARDITIDSDGYMTGTERDTALFAAIMQANKHGHVGPILGDLGWYSVNIRQIVQPIDNEFPRFLAERGEELVKSQQQRAIDTFEMNLQRSATIIDQRWMTFRY